MKRNFSQGNFYKLRSPNTYWSVHGYLPNEVDKSWKDYFYTIIKNRRKVNKLKSLYKNSVDFNWNRNCEYIFFALHYQPEETSCPTGGVYADQILILQHLDFILPQDVKIVVKEHKSQFYLDQEGAAGRNIAFYRRIKSISNRVILESVDADPFDLIDSALATITVSGTIGWESAIRGTPTLHFGRAWYEGMPNTLRIKTKNDLNQAINKLEDMKVRDSLDGIYRFHKALEDGFIKATHYKSYQGKGDVELDSSVLALRDGILSKLKEVSSGES